MQAERWQLTQHLFHEVSERPPEERAAYLADACAGDDELRREVESLITSAESGEDFLDEPQLNAGLELIRGREFQSLVGKLIGPYLIDSHLGRGGMGDVYLARDQRLGRLVALKFLPESFNQDAEWVARFDREARAASAIAHPNIAHIYEVGESEGHRYIAMEFIEGLTLRERLNRGIEFVEAINIALEITRALVAAHAVGVLHRDIKPENIMLHSEGFVKILDFGLAKVGAQSESATHVMGTVRYMSPEQARGQSVDSRTDIFSLGVVLYEMVTNHAPFEDESAGGVVQSILRETAQPLAKYAPEAPEELQRIISKALDKNKEKRYQSANDLLVALKELRQKLELTIEPQSLFGRPQRAVASTHDAVRTPSKIELFASRISEHKPMVGFVGLLVLLIGIGYPLKNWIGSRGAGVKEVKVIMLSSTGNVEDAAISRDAKYVAYIPYEYVNTPEAFRSSIRMRELATNTDREVTPQTGAYDDLVFSPDGKYLYYSDRADAATNHRSLYRRSTEGGLVAKIVNDFPHGSGKITFSPDGEKLAFIRQDERVSLGTLVIANLDGTQEESIITRKAPDYFPTQSRSASWSPDGKHIVYVGVDAADGSARIFEVDLESLTGKPLTSLKWNELIGDLTWLPDSSGILFIAGNTSISNAIWRVTYPAGQLEQITNDLNNYYLLSVAGDSNTVVTIQRTRNVDLWIAPDSDASRARRIMPSRQNGFYGVAWAPDGRIVYTSETSGNSDIWIANADGTNQRQLTADVHQDVWPAVTKDGRYIVFISNRAGADHVWRMDIDGKNQIQLTDGVKTGHPDCSPDSKWVVYPASVSGNTTIWKVSIEGGAPYEISDLACDNPAVSHDGRMIACMSDTHQRLILPFDGGQAIATIELRVRPGFVSGIPRWMPDDRALMYADFSDVVMNFWIKPIDGGQEKQLTYFRPDQVAASHGVLGYAWSPGGKDLLYARYERKSDMVMISGFK